MAGTAGVVAFYADGGMVATGLPPWLLGLQSLVFAGATGALLAGSRGDTRVVSLGVVFALVATSFARVPTNFLESALGDAPAIALLRSIRVDAFLPLFAWRFFQRFPRGISSQRSRAVARLAVAMCGVGGAVLLAANVALPWVGEGTVLSAFDAADLRSPYWSLVYGATLPVLPFLFWRTRRVRESERRRLALFAAAIMAAVLPVGVYVLAMGLSPAFADWFDAGGRGVVLPAIQLLILSVPLTTAYSVLVDRVLPVRVILRQAAQVTFARGLVTVGAAFPFLWIAWNVYRWRGDTLGELARGPEALAILAAGVVGVAAVRARSRAQDAIDRTFFRERYDARRTLLAVAERSHGSGGSQQLATLLAGEIDQALHLERIDVLVRDPAGQTLRAESGGSRPLDLRAPLASWLSEQARPVDVDLERQGSPLRQLPDSDRQWLADGGFCLLVPLLSSTRELVGLLALGEKRSELPFGGEDRQLLAAVAGAGALALESRLRSHLPPTQEAADAGHAPARVCVDCGLVAASESGADAPSCADCGGPLESAPVPAVLLGKFEVERRVGEGGMGVVYRARDTALERPVAIKTLPVTTPEESVQLRREARAMAAVSHPNLALIFSAESYHGTPLLVTEFLEGGMLSDRIAAGGLGLAPLASVGTEMALALGHLHRAGILHRDVKPSNIGFTSEGIAKLLDFGLARSAAEPGAGLTQMAEPLAWRMTGSEDGLIGTPLYMSPEALRGETADVGHDLWSLAATLYEAISGRNPVERDTWQETRDAIENARIADLREWVPACAESVARFFAEALHADRRRRPADARELGERWRSAVSDAS